ncbi:MAG: GGDEF domain-containing protein [Eubacteriales bacterium]
MFPFPPKSNLKLEDIITETMMLLASLIFLVSIWRIYRSHEREKMWLVSLTGIFLYSVGAALDLLDEFYKLPQVIPRLIENGFFVLGLSVSSAGILMTMRTIIDSANVDFITGLYNKAYLRKMLSMEIERSKRYNLQLSVLFIDLDNFKKVNDQLGHTVGDVFLRNVSEMIKKTARTTDIVARYGGDELVILMPQTGVSGAENLLKRVQEAVYGMELPDGYRISVSGGAAVFPADGGNTDQLINLADKRMYQNKQRNISP